MMKFLAVLLIGCIVFLSSFSGMVSAAPVAAPTDCCKKADAKTACHHKPAQNEAGGCEKPVCAMLFSCSICGFIPVATLTNPFNYTLVLKTPIPLYRTGDVSAYHKADWKPPKSC